MSNHTEQALSEMSDEERYEKRYWAVYDEAIEAEDDEGDCGYPEDDRIDSPL